MIIWTGKTLNLDTFHAVKRKKIVQRRETMKISKHANSIRVQMQHDGTKKSFQILEKVLVLDG